MCRPAFSFALAFLTAAAVGCNEGPTDVPRDESDGQQHSQLGPSFSTSTASTYDIVGVGANFGNTAASQICSSGDVDCTYTQISEAAFNAMSVADLRAAYDVLIFTWVSDPALNADWTTRLLPYMDLGGGIVFEDPGNLGDLAPGVVALNFEAGPPIVVSAVVPGLTDGIRNSFANTHIRFAAWDPALSQFLTHAPSGSIVGLWGRFGSGCIVLTGPDQHFHGFRGAPDPAGNQYDLLLNEVEFVLGLAGTCRIGPPATLELEPPTATNTVDTRHCVTATVRDASGNPVPDIVVRFEVRGAVNTSGSATTDENGQAIFCYQGPPLPGADVITAFADTDGDGMQDLDEPGNRATKTWVLPPTTPLCKINNGGRITAMNGDKATFGGDAKSSETGATQGQQEYQDHGPAQRLNMHSISVLAIVCDGSGEEASIYGDATIDGVGVYAYRIKVRDRGEPGAGRDTYWILLGNGYTSGDQTLEGGNVQISRQD
jgi:hypothetical protein